MSQTQNINKKANEGIVFRLFEKERFPTKKIRSESDVQLEKCYEIHVKHPDNWETDRIYLSTSDSEIAMKAFREVVEKYSRTLEQREVARRIIQITDNE